MNLPTLLLIEDNDDNRDLVLAMLEEVYQIVDHADASSCLAWLDTHQAQHDIQLALCDISLPGMDGMALLQQMRQHPAWGHRPVIALTSHAMKGDEARFIAAGFDAYLSKPIVDEVDLLDLIARTLGKEAL